MSGELPTHVIAAALPISDEVLTDAQAFSQELAPLLAEEAKTLLGRESAKTAPLSHEAELRLDAIEVHVRAAREGRECLSLALQGITGLVGAIRHIEAKERQ